MLNGELESDAPALKKTVNKRLKLQNPGDFILQGFALIYIYLIIHVKFFTSLYVTLFITFYVLAINHQPIESLQFFKNHVDF